MKSIFEGNKKVDLVDLYSQTKNLDAIFSKINDYVTLKCSDSKIAKLIIESLYSVNTIDNVDRLIKIESGDYTLLDELINEYKNKKEEKFDL